nr:reverse transcriptase domain-containing protein [Tanacetum cinerariifolium]
MALADLGASINIMPLSVWKNCMLPKLVPTRTTLELANRSVAYPAGITEDVFVPVGKFTFPVDFVVVDYDVDPRVSLILGRPFLRMADSSPETYIDIIDPILERFTNEPALVYSFPLGDDDIFDFIRESTLPEESSKSSEIATLLSSPFGNKDKSSTPSTFKALVDTDVEKLFLKRLSRNPSISTSSKPTSKNKNKKESQTCNFRYVVEDSDMEASNNVDEEPREDKNGRTPD